MKRTILVCVLQEIGHLNPTFKLAHTLQDRGFDVKFCAIPDFEALLREKGFDVLPFLPELHPPGFSRRPSLGVLAERRAIAAHFEEVTRRLIAPDGPRAQLAALQPALMIVDVNLTLLALLARQLGVPLMLLNTSLPQTRDARVPPLRSANGYGASLGTRVAAYLAWRRVIAARRFGAAAATLLGMCPPYELARRAASRFGSSASALDSETVYMPQLRDAPELVLCPQVFDFPRLQRGTRSYVESLDLERREPQLDWDRIDEHKPLIYVSMGSQRYQTKHVRRFLQDCAAAFASRPDWQAIIALGRQLEPSDLPVHAPNVLAVSTAPQLAVLRRARVMVTHGGLGSVKECIFHGVPMLVLPLAIDQPGNAARVLHHGLGLSDDVRTLRAERLLAQVERLLTEPGFQRAVGRMRAEFERVESAQLGADQVQQLIAQSMAKARAE